MCRRSLNDAMADAICALWTLWAATGVGVLSIGARALTATVRPIHSRVDGSDMLVL